MRLRPARQTVSKQCEAARVAGKARHGSRLSFAYNCCKVLSLREWPLRRPVRKIRRGRVRQGVVYAARKQADHAKQRGQGRGPTAPRVNAPADGILKRVEEGLVELGRAAFLACPASLELLDVRDRLLHVSDTHPAVMHGVAGLVGGQGGGCHCCKQARYRCFTRVGRSASARLLAQASAAELVYNDDRQCPIASLYVNEETISTCPEGFKPWALAPLAPHMLRWCVDSRSRMLHIWAMLTPFQMGSTMAPNHGHLSRRLLRPL